MKKAVKELLRKNNLREKEISKENDEIYTNMIVYIRTSNMSDYNQEVVREDIINMILDGQRRGDNIQEVMGGNYKEVCDEIIAAMPKRTPKERLLDFVGITLNVLGVLGIIAIVETLVYAYLLKKQSGVFILTVGDLINAVIIMLAAIAIVYYISKTSFATMQVGNKITFLKLWLTCSIIILLLFLCNRYFTTIVLELPLLTAILLVLGVFLVNKVIESIS